MSATLQSIAKRCGAGVVMLMAATVFFMAQSSGMRAQNRTERKVTPVESDDKKPRQPIWHYYDKHGEPLENPVLFLSELDTVKAASPKAVYPLFNGVTVGVNFFDAIMKLAGQKHYDFDVSAEVSLHNWFFPVLEAGIGFAKNTPEDGNFTYKGKPSAYFKAGINYNFLYKSNPDYRIFLGLRGAYSNFSYELRDVHLTSDYWHQDERIDILNQRAHAWYGEVLGGINVKIAGDFSLGWTVRYKFKFNTPEGSQSKPWFIPGYGTTSPLRMTFSASWTFGMPRHAD